MGVTVVITINLLTCYKLDHGLSWSIWSLFITQFIYQTVWPLQTWESKWKLTSFGISERVVCCLVHRIYRRMYTTCVLIQSHSMMYILLNREPLLSLVFPQALNISWGIGMQNILRGRECGWGRGSGVVWGRGSEAAAVLMNNG